MNQNPFGEPPYHLVALSGGKDSTALAFALKEKHPELSFKYYCTPTGDELPEMFDWWVELGERLGSRIIPIMEMTLEGCIKKNKMLPNFRARFCTRQIKIEPAIKMMRQLSQNGPVTNYVGLRADEETRLGGIFDGLEVNSRFPFKEWGWTLKDVWAYLEKLGLKERLPARTDCALCYHQRIGEWYRLWKDHPERFARGEAIEAEYGATFRTPDKAGLDTRSGWPVSLAGMREAFASGRVPRSEQQLDLFSRQTMDAGACRVCSL